MHSRRGSDRRSSSPGRGPVVLALSRSPAEVRTGGGSLAQMLALVVSSLASFFYSLACHDGTSSRMVAESFRSRRRRLKTDALTEFLPRCWLVCLRYVKSLGRG